MGYFGVFGLLFLFNLYHLLLLRCPFPDLLCTGFVFFGLLLIFLVLNIVRLLNSSKAFEIRHCEAAENGICSDARHVMESCMGCSESCPS